MSTIILFAPVAIFFETTDAAINGKAFIVPEVYRRTCNVRVIGVTCFI